MYAADDSAAELAIFGLSAADFEPDIVHVWPENLRALNLFTSLATQWRTGMSGPTGLDYNVLFHRMDRLALPAEEYEQLFDDIRVIESEALTIIHKKST